jgi:RsmE family RNA methyltransferase
LNIILFHPAEVEHPLSRRDVRASHILEVLRLRPGGKFDAGVINGAMGKGSLDAINDDALILSFSWEKTPPLLCPIHLLIGLPRPQTARDLLREATSIGVASLHFVRSERSEPSYANSSLWKSDEWKKCVINGASQAFCTRLPEITHGGSLPDTVAQLPADATRVALDNYEAASSLSEFSLITSKPVALALGSERGWSPGERTFLREAGFGFAHLGMRVLRTETACIAALAIVRSKLGLL